MRLSVHPPTCPSTHPSILPAFLSVFLSPTLLPFLSVFLSPTSPPRPSLHPASLIVSLGPPLPGPLLRAQAVLCTEGRALLPSGQRASLHPLSPARLRAKPRLQGFFYPCFLTTVHIQGAVTSPGLCGLGAGLGQETLCVSPALGSGPLAFPASLWRGLHT